MSGPVERPEQPAQRVDGRYQRQEDVPEPDEDEELLVEQVDGQRALHDVLVHARLVPDLELAQRHARKPLRVQPVLAADQPASSCRHSHTYFQFPRERAADQLFDDVDAVEVVVDLEEGVEEEELADGVGEVHELDGHVPAGVAPDVRYTTTNDGHVAGDEIVAVELAADDAAHLGDEVFDADHAAGAILALCQQVAIHLIHDVPDRLHAQKRLERRGRAQYVARPT